MNKPILLDNTEVSQLSDLLKRNQISYDDVLWDMFRRPRRQGDFIWEQAALSGAALKAMLGPGAKLSGLHDLVCLSILIGMDNFMNTITFHQCMRLLACFPGW
jgi:hypothetical protein